MTTRRRHIVFAFIHVFIAVQLLVPLSYYTTRGDRYDERFAWRMFSSVRGLTCQVAFRSGPDRTPIARLHGTFHEAWINLAKRGRLPVVRAMANALCEQHEHQVSVELVCTTVAGETERKGGDGNFCYTGSL